MTIVAIVIFTSLILLSLVDISFAGFYDNNDFGLEGDEAEVNLVIHVVPHSHVDAGWLEPAETTLESAASVILSKVLEQLDNAPDRRFVWAETMLFRKWYAGLGQGDKMRLRKLVASGRFEFVGGGVVEHDEALNTWDAVVDQMTDGHEWLEQHLGVRPTVAWQADSAGHSDATPALLSQMGFEALFLGRVHFRVRQQFSNQKHLEFIWRGKDLGGARDRGTEAWKPGDVFTHIMYNGFAAPEGYDFESGKGVRQVTNPKRRAERLVDELRKWAASYRTHHLFVPFGDTTRFIEADKQYTNMEKLMVFINRNIPDVQIRFSTPTEYLRSVRETAAVTALEFPQYVGDFFPYADHKDSYWSGLFSSRMKFKENVRDISALAHTAEIFFALARARATALGDAPRIKSIINGQVEAEAQQAPLDWDTKLFQDLGRLREVSTWMTHHHAITGASRAQVIQDFMSNMRQAQQSGISVLEASLAQLLTKRSADFKATGPRVRPVLTDVPFNLEEDLRAIAEETGAASAVQHPIIVYNPDPVERVEIVHIYVGADWRMLRHVHVVDHNGVPVRAQLHHLLATVIKNSRNVGGMMGRPGGRMPGGRGGVGMGAGAGAGMGAGGMGMGAGGMGVGAGQRNRGGGPGMGRANNQRFDFNDPYMQNNNNYNDPYGAGGNAGIGMQGGRGGVGAGMPGGFASGASAASGGGMGFGAARGAAMGGGAPGGFGDPAGMPRGNRMRGGGGVAGMQQQPGMGMNNNFGGAGGDYYAAAGFDNRGAAGMNGRRRLNVVMPDGPLDGGRSLDAQGAGGPADQSRIFLSFAVRVPPLGVATFFCFTSSPRDRMKNSQLGSASTPVTKLYNLANGKILANRPSAPRMNGGGVPGMGQGVPGGFGAGAGVGFGAAQPYGIDPYGIDMGRQQAFQQQQQGQGQGQRMRGGGAGGATGAAQGGVAADAGTGSKSNKAASGVTEDGFQIMNELANAERTLSIENELVQVHVNTATGMLQSVLDKRTKRNTLLNQRFLQYPGSRSGTYLFRPEPVRAVDFGSSITVGLTKGPMFEQLQVIGDNGLGQTIRVYKSLEGTDEDPGAAAGGAGAAQDGELTGAVYDLLASVEINVVVGFEYGVDTVMRLETSMDTDGIFYTDNELGDLVKRTTHREAPLASNIFPAVSTIALRDNQATAVTRMGQVLALVGKIPFAASSPFADSGTGTIEVMLHRNHEEDDGRGLEEPLTDMSTTHFACALLVGTPNELLERIPHVQRRVQRPLRQFYAREHPDLAKVLSRENWASRFVTYASFVVDSLPREVDMQTLRARTAAGDQVLLRFRNLAASTRTTIDLAHGFLEPTFQIQGLQEAALAGGATLHARFGAPFRGSSFASLASHASFEYMMQPRVGLADAGGALGTTGDPGMDLGSNAQLVLQPGEIRTILLTLSVLEDDKRPSSMYTGTQGSGASSSTRSNFGNAGGMSGGSSTGPSTGTKPGAGMSQGGMRGSQKQQPKASQTQSGGADSLGSSSSSNGGTVSGSGSGGLSRETEEQKARLEEIALEHRSNIEAMQRRVKMYKSNIDQLLADIKKFDDQGKASLRDATVGDLKTQEASLEQAHTSLQSSKQELKDVLEQIQTLDSSYQIDTGFMFEDEIRIRTAEATVHGAVAGAAAMLLFLVAGNWVFAGGLRLARSYVPISVRFQEKGPTEVDPEMAKLN